jgi:hypothetical protein
MERHDYDAAWFSRALGRDVRSVEWELLPEQGRASHCHRVWLSGEASAAGSVVVKRSLEDPTYLTRRLGLGTYRLEVDFYLLIAPRLGDLVPTCHHADADDETGHFTIVLEDLAPARSGSSGEGVDDDVLTAVEGLARLHASYWGDDSVTQVTGRCKVPGMLDQREVGEAQRGFARHLLEAKQASHPLPEIIVEATHAVIDNHARLMERMRTRPLTCTHGDAHLPQMMFPSERGGRFAIIDFQTPHYGSGAADLSALLLTSGLSADKRALLLAPMLDRYHEGLVRAGVEEYDRQALDSDYRLMLHNRIMLALMLPHRETPEDLALWRTRLLDPLVPALREADFVGFVRSL